MTTQGSAESPASLLKSQIKAAITAARESRWPAFFAIYEGLFSSAEFEQVKVDDQRQALKLMIMTKGVPGADTPVAIAAYQAAWRSLDRLSQLSNDARDFELLGITHLRLQDEDGARRVLNHGLTLAQAANDGDLCGVFLRHLSTL